MRIKNFFLYLQKSKGMETEKDRLIDYDVYIRIDMYIKLHNEYGKEISIDIDEYNGVDFDEKSGYTIIYFPWDNESMVYPEQKVSESIEEVKELLKYANKRKEELEKKYEKQINENYE